MGRPNGKILLDNNAIGDAVDLRVWKALINAYAGQLETVQEVEIEAGTYFRQKENAQELMSTLSSLTINTVSSTERAVLALSLEGVALDPGESALWAHAHIRKDSWVFCGPDKASLRAAVKLGHRDKLISLEELMQGAGLSTKGLPTHQTKSWLNKTVSQIVIDENCTTK